MCTFKPDAFVVKCQAKILENRVDVALPCHKLLYCLAVLF